MSQKVFLVMNVDEGSADAVCSTEELAAEWKQHYERETGYKYRVIGVELRTEAPDAWFNRVHGQKAE